MDQFLDYIERYKFAILGTVLFHVLFFFVTNFVTLKSPFNGSSYQEEITEVEIETDAIEMDEEMLEMLNKQNQLNNEPLYNLASDENDQRERSYENFSTQSIDEQVESEARKLEQQYFEEWASTHPDEPAPSRSNNSETADDNQQKKQTANQNNNVDTEGGNAFAGQVMVSFNLKSRKAYSLEIPGYTCNGSGTVVIDIKVDKNGDVRDAELNTGLSVGATECMIAKAKRYAKRARFNYSGTADNAQNGTITYKFQGQ